MAESWSIDFNKYTGLVNYTYQDVIIPRYSFGKRPDAYRFIGSSINRKPPEKKKQNNQQLWKNDEYGNPIITKERLNELLETAQLSAQLKNQNEQQNEDKNTQEVKNIEASSNSHPISSRTRKKIRNKLFAWFDCTQDKQNFTFVTLTLMCVASDSKAIIALNNFLTAERKKHGKFSYLWVAERQKKNEDRLHFHIACNHYWDVKTANKNWVKYQILAGIKHHTGRKNFNPFQVKRINNYTKLASYLNKYVTKNEDTFECSPWRCSHDISKLFTGYRSDLTDYNELLRHPANFSYHNRRTNSTTSVGITKTDYAYIHRICQVNETQKRFNDLRIFNEYVINSQQDNDTIREQIPLIFASPVEQILFCHTTSQPQLWDEDSG